MAAVALGVGAAAVLVSMPGRSGTAPSCPRPPAVASPAAAAAPTRRQPALLRVVALARHPHDPTAFTQGLAYAGGDQLYEGTGRDSDVRRVAIASGTVLAREALPAPLFGEGVALAGAGLVQLTWRDGVGVVRDRCSLTERGRFGYSGEGWGLAGDSRVLWRSDGSDVLHVLDPRTLRELHRIPVRDRGVPVRSLNELEYVDGALFANVWRTDWVARIDPSSGLLTGWIDASSLDAAARPRTADREAVLNGIAWDPGTDRLWMTGKLWPALFEVRLEPARGRLPPPGLAPLARRAGR